jgi:CrcB protein
VISTYFWIAVGGALGSMARFWLAVFVAERLGPEFPWGTILINIVGSFVIGFFATFSGPGGRFAASFNARAFVMVGICGGFTTFSAFSLQTLDLARDSRWLQAGGNVVLSVVACLLAVWAGHAFAAALLPTSTQE